MRDEELIAALRDAADWHAGRHVARLATQAADRLTACQQEVGRSREERDEAQNRYSSAVMGEIETTQRAEAAEARIAELVNPRLHQRQGPRG